MATISTQRSRIADDLIENIRAGQYPVGSKLPSERQLSDQYKVSRPVIREALGMLSMLDLIDIQMGRGAFVTSADLPSAGEVAYGLIDIVDAREVIERGALRLADQRATDADRESVAAALEALETAVSTGIATTQADFELHRVIVHSAWSPMLVKLWDDMTDEIARTVRVSPHGRAMSTAILDNHRRLANGIIEGSVDDAVLACSELYDDHRAFLRSLVG